MDLYLVFLGPVVLKQNAVVALHDFPETKTVDCLTSIKTTHIRPPRIRPGQQTSGTVLRKSSATPDLRKFECVDAIDPWYLDRSFGESNNEMRNLRIVRKIRDGLKPT